MSLSGARTLADLCSQVALAAQPPPRYRIDLICTSGRAAAGQVESLTSWQHLPVGAQVTCSPRRSSGCLPHVAGRGRRQQARESTLPYHCAIARSLAASRPGGHPAGQLEPSPSFSRGSESSALQGEELQSGFGGRLLDASVCRGQSRASACTARLAVIRSAGVTRNHRGPHVRRDRHGQALYGGGSTEAGPDHKPQRKTQAIQSPHHDC